MQVPGSVVFDSVAWLLPMSLSAFSACALLRLEVSDPRLVGNPAGRRKRKIGVFLWSTYILGIILIYFIYITGTIISRDYFSRGDILERWPQLIFADLVVRAIGFCLGPAGLLFALGALIPAARGSPLLAALGIPATESVRAHARLGRISVVCLFGHAFGYIFFWLRRGGLADMWTEATEWPQFGINNLAGIISIFGGGGILAGSSHPTIRRRWYSVFYYAHMGGSLVFVAFAAAHWRAVVFYFAPATFLWAAELAQRRQRVSQQTEVIATRVSETLLKVWWPLPGNGPYPISCTLSANEFVYLR